MPAVIVQDLCIYPLKSAQGIPRERVQLGPTGFAWDRHWMVIRPDGQFLTQRTHPALARIGVTLTPQGLRLESESRPPLWLALGAAGDARQVRVWKDRCAGLDQGEAAAEWLSAVLGESVRVVRVPERAPRRADPAYAAPHPAPITFVDGFPILVCNQASLELLNERLPKALPMNRFRPNLVLAGLEPFAEDRIETLRVGAVRLRLVKPCTRCVIPSRDQRTGISDVDPLPALRTFRYDQTLRGVTFGTNAIIAAGSGESIERGARCECQLANT
ncbi:MAG: MOSC domain-containing protein [Steroidobacteraceae bacterium]